jgi:hypothetical protein
MTNLFPFSPNFFKLSVLAARIPLVAADSGDDFTNNLFTDIAPLVSHPQINPRKLVDSEIIKLSLFGEQVTKQFLSQSMGWADNIIFAMAPLGIITAVISAIRCGGYTWMRAVIGRAREGAGYAEVELMSSTSENGMYDL